MSRPEDIPQDAWEDAHGSLAATSTSVPVEGLDFIIIQEAIARAILKAKEDEREACEKAALGQRFPAYTTSVKLEKNKYGTLEPGSPYDRGRFDAFVAIRSRSKPTQC